MYSLLPFNFWSNNIVSTERDNIEIRIATGDDAELLSWLGAITFYEAYFEQDSPENMVDYLGKTYNAEQIGSEIADPLTTYFIMFRKGSAIGFAKLIREAREPEIVGRSTAQIKRIYLVERVWGKGLGAIFLDHCIGIVSKEGRDSVWLDVWDQNLRAQKFYFKHGFEKVGTLEFPYGDSVGINWVLERML